MSLIMYSRLQNVTGGGEATCVIRQGRQLSRIGRETHAVVGPTKKSHCKIPWKS